MCTLHTACNQQQQGALDKKLTNLGCVKHDFAVCGRRPFRPHQQIVRDPQEAVGQRGQQHAGHTQQLQGPV